MSVVAVAVVLGLLVLLLLRTRALGAGGALTCVVFGLVLGVSPAGPVVHSALNSAGGWAWSTLNGL